MEALARQAQSVVLHTSAGRGWRGLEAALLHLPSGRAESPGSDKHMLGMHFGRPVNAICTIGDNHLRFVQRTRDIGLVPAGYSGAWEDDHDLQLLRMTLHPSLLTEVAEQLGKNPADIGLVPQFQLRDLRLETIALAIKADIVDRTPSDPLYGDLLANALAVRLVELASGPKARSGQRSAPSMSPRQVTILTDFIESNLAQKLSLAQLAAVAGVSPTHLKAMFRNSVGIPVYRYVIGRRIEYARVLLSTTSLPAGQIALTAGFAHQSHMASTMRRLLGYTPSEIHRPSKKSVRICQNLPDLERTRAVHLPKL